MAVWFIFAMWWSYKFSDIWNMSMVIWEWRLGTHICIHTYTLSCMSGCLHTKCINSYMHICTQTCLHNYITFMHVCLYIDMHMTHACMHTYIITYIHTDSWMCLYLHVHIHIHMQTHMHTLWCVRLYAYVHTWTIMHDWYRHAHACLPIYIHTYMHMSQDEWFDLVNLGTVLSFSYV